jgi:hemoglobin-like flavoprotein
MAMLSIMVANLNNIEEIAPTVQDLGRRHIGYGATLDDYDAVGRALMWTLEQGLREQFTPDVKSAWLAAFTALAKVMAEGASEAQATESSFALPSLRRRAA